MKFGRRRFLRFTAAMALAGLIASQIPMTGMTAFAQDSYVPSNSGGTSQGIRNVLTGGIIALVGYGIYATIRDSHAAATAAGAAAGPAPGTAVPPVAPAGQRTIYDILAGDPNSFKTETAAVDQTPDIRDIYKNTSKDRNGVYTVFAPDETAFAKLPSTDLSVLLGPANATPRESLLSYHTVKGRYTIADLKALPDGTNLVTLSNTTLAVTNADGVVKVNGVPVIESDLDAINGIVHPIQTVLTPGAPVASSPDTATPTTAPAPATPDTTPAPAPGPGGGPALPAPTGPAGPAPVAP